MFFCGDLFSLAWDAMIWIGGGVYSFTFYGVSVVKGSFRLHAKQGTGFGYTGRTIVRTAGHI